ncbi:Pr6Pr family membrane protein [Methylibium sp.]|uniref:Pr6Pr family membrane protein n=1 Tax=Methylibium sp. TaxID=2067992 RepID=UPI0025DB3EBC|nr:Pr6Pr family membrane protein [Methylibium sp.]
MAGVASAGVLLQFYLSLRLASANGQSLAFGVASYFGYFTILTNLLVCLALALPLLARASAGGRFFERPSVAAGVATSIAFVGLAYHLLLRHIWAPQGLQWLADVLLHYAVPALYVLYWWFVLPKAPLRWTDPLVWSGYPAAYLAYGLARGAAIGSYPYPFIDVAAIGYRQTAINAVGLLIAYIGLGFVLVALGKAKARNNEG